MAIDSRSKRVSAMFFGVDHVIIPDGAISVEDMQSIRGFYDGIDLTEIHQLELSYTGKTPLVNITGKKPNITLVGRA